MATDSESEVLKYLVLTQIKGLGPVTENALLGLCGSIGRCFSVRYDDLINANERSLYDGGRMRECQIKSFIMQREDKNLWVNAEEILRISDSSGIKVITHDAMEYPERFRSIKDMPIVLYAKGRLKINEYTNSIGIVGARRCTVEGKKKAIDITSMTVQRNTAVISGMAKGIDSYAHTAAIKSGGYTIAVLGNGVDICYPKEHEKLYEEIAEKGCVLSEYPPGMPPRKYNFPNRNRLIAGLVDKLYVIDAGRNSGALSTVEYSKKYGREVVMCL